MVTLKKLVITLNKCTPDDQKIKKFSFALRYYSLCDLRLIKI